MHYIYLLASISIMAALTLAVIRVVRGPTLFDRVLAGNAVGTLSILLLVIIGFLFKRPDWADIGLAYALLNIIATLAVLKYFRYGDLACDPCEKELSS
ncbi:MAG: hypothetical protein TECD_00651 [Hyphomicrobiaceae bacterium hypho_1]